MGTLKDEMRGVSEDRLLCEKAEDGEHPESSDGTSVTEGQQTNTGEESTTQDDQPKMDYNKDSKNNDISLKSSVDLERQSISVAVPSTPDPTDPRSPAPFGQHHMRTQVSLEVVQSRSAATSPMTPPEGGHSFFFPSSFGKTEKVGSDSKDAELQAGQQVEFCSVATSPMTPKTQFFSSFPPLQSQGSVQRKNEEGQGCQVGTKIPAEPESEISKALKLSSSKELKREDLSGSGAPVSPTNCPAASLMNSESKQQRMGSMDQDITILVTQHGNTEEDEDKTHPTIAVEPEMVKLEEQQEEDDQSHDGKNTVVECEQEKSKSTIKTDKAFDPTQAKTKFKSAPSLEAQESRDLPESPAPFGCHNMRTQVSLEVVQCHSAATSPMTPPEGDQAFCFPSTLTQCGAVGTEPKNAELQAGQRVEYRSVATAPMTPRTPTATTFPEIQKGASIEEKIEEEEEEGGEEKITTKQDNEDDDGDDDDEEEEEEEEEIEEQEETENEKEQFQGQQNEERNCKDDKCEEPVQEVSWDEKGMTWEVYGAVVEVSVLGSAIQKHLEKQVKKQKTSMPPPPPLNPSATPLTSEASPRGSGSGKGRGSKRGEGKPSRRRRNPFRLMMENMQQPHCCSRAHTTE